MNKKELGIYIHIPFCVKKCYYCDFISFPNKTEVIQKYIETLKEEINNTQLNLEEYTVTTIYIGGGTPSFIDSKYIMDIMNELSKKFDLSNVKEATIELNPGTITKSKLEDYKKSNINRLSIGLQSTNNNLLKAIGRIHTYEQFLEGYKLAREAGFNNINIDLMLGLPKQNIEILKNSLDNVIELNPEHISVYSLILEEGTQLYEMVKTNKCELIEDDLERQMYWYVKDKLELNGYKHYEISNFAKDGLNSLHNTNCWEQKEYIGYGIAAHSYINNIRFSNTDNLEEYINYLDNDKHINIKENINKIKIINETQNISDKEKEYMLLGLRKIEGVRISEFKKKFIKNPLYLFRIELEKLINEELLIVDGDYIKLTNKGLDLANQVWEEFI